MRESSTWPQHAVDHVQCWCGGIALRLMLNGMALVECQCGEAVSQLAILTWGIEKLPAIHINHDPGDEDRS